MSESPSVICAARASSCICALPPGHDGPHAGGNDAGKWNGTYGEDDFDVVSWPTALPYEGGELTIGLLNPGLFPPNIYGLLGLGLGGDDD